MCSNYRKLYVASKYQNAQLVRSITPNLKGCLHSWAFSEASMNPEFCANVDLALIRSCDVFILLDMIPQGWDTKYDRESNEGGVSSVGRYVELGIALAAGAECFYVGPKMSVFHNLCTHLTWEEFHERFLGS